MTVKIDTDATINNIFLTDQSSSPSTPASGKTRVFSKADGLYVVDDDGLTIGPFMPADGWIPSKLTWTWSSSDDPSYVIETNSNVTGTFSAGMRFKVNDTSTKMFIVTKVAFSGSNTQLTMYGGTDYDLTSGTLTSPYYSTMKSPLNFSLDPNKWMIETKDTNNLSTGTPAQNTWYNLGSLAVIIPIGCWNVSYQCLASIADTTAGSWGTQIALSTANNSASDADFVTYCYASDAAKGFIQTAHRTKYLTLTSKTTYYLNERTTQANLDSINVRGDVGTTIIRAVCAYL